MLKYLFLQPVELRYDKIYKIAHLLMDMSINFQNRPGTKSPSSLYFLKYNRKMAIQAKVLGIYNFFQHF